MAKKRKKKRGNGYSLGSIWDLSTQLMDQQLGPQRAQATDQFRRDLATLQGSMNSFNAGSNMAQRSIDEVQNLATGQAQANAQTAMSGLNSLAGAARDAMVPWVNSQNAFIGGQGAPQLAMDEITNMGMGSPVAFLMEAGPYAAEAAGAAHDQALNQKHDQELLQDNIDNTKNEIQGNINELHNKYRDQMAGLQGQAVNWKPEDFANYLKLQDANKANAAKANQDWKLLNAGIAADPDNPANIAAKDAAKAAEDAQKTRGKQKKAHTEAMKAMKAAISDITERIRADEDVRYGKRTVPIKLSRIEKLENDAARRQQLPLPHATEKEVKVLRSLSEQRWIASRKYQKELAEMAKRFAFGSKRIQAIIQAALRHNMMRHPGEAPLVPGY